MAQGLLDARQAFAVGDPVRADQIAKEALQHLEAEPATDTEPARSRRAALGSALLAVRGGAAVRAGRLDDALALFEKSRDQAAVSDSASVIAAAALNLVDVWTHRGRHDAEDPLIEEASRVAAGGPYGDILVKILLERGDAATRAQAFGDALALYDRAVAMRPAWPFPWYQRAWARFLSGDASGALDDFRECAQRRQPFFTVLREIRCLEDVAAGLLPLEAYRSYCRVREQVRDRPGAVDEFAERLGAQHPDFAPAHLLRAEARLALGNVDGAREAVQEALQHDPDPDTAAAALFVEWNLARATADEASQRAVEQRLLEGYADQPAAEIVKRLRGAGRREIKMRWTWALDGTFRLEEATPSHQGGGSPGGRH
ncbi:MAG: tetratricopeptide repeat protein [bacterium]